MVANLFHVVVGLTGLLVLYSGLFLTETEEGKYRIALRRWVRVDDLQSRAMTGQAAFLQQVSSLVADGFVTLFGQKLFSIKSVASCLCFSTASLYLSLATVRKEIPILSKPVLLVCCLILLTCGLSKKLRYLGFAVLALGGLVELNGLRGSLKMYQLSLTELTFSALLYVIAIFSGIAFGSLTRWSLHSNTPALIAIILATVALAAARGESLDSSQRKMLT